MFNTPFYHGQIKQCIIAFGALFSHIKIQRFKTDGSVGQVIACPITYGPKEKVIVRLQQDPTLDNQVMVTLPRLAFQITNYSRDMSRAINKNQKIVCHKPDGTTIGVFSPIPYNLDITLYLLTKGTEDSLAVIEQILPIFMPEYTATINSIMDMNITQDVPFILNSVSVDDNWEGDFAKRMVVHELNFTAKLNLYGNYGHASIITRTDTSVKIFDDAEIDHHVSTGDPETGQITSDFWE
jgi:hypothetical protein